MLKNWKSLFIVTNAGEDKKKEEETKLENSIKEAENLLDELADFDDLDEKLEEALTGEVVEKEGVVDNAVIEKLLAEVEKNNRPGFDYFEYKQSLKALEKMPMNEVTQYRSAFVTASTMGITLDNLLESANFYLGILDGENKKFTTTFETEKKNKLDKKEEKIIQLNKTIQEKKALILKLTEEIGEHEKQISDLKYEIKDSKKEIDATQNNFIVSFNYIKSEFTKDIARMKEYLK